MMAEPLGSSNMDNGKGQNDDNQDPNIVILTGRDETPEFLDYRRVAFYNLNVQCTGVRDGIYNILASSIMFLKAPNDISNLCFRKLLPTSDDWNSIKSRKDLCKVLVPSMTQEAMCDLSQAFIHNAPDFRSVDILKPQKPVLFFVHFIIAFKAKKNQVKNLQRKYSNAIWYMHKQGNNSPSELQLKFTDEVLKEQCALIFTKSSFTDDDDDFENISDDESTEDQLVEVKIRAYAYKTSENETTVKNIIKEKGAIINYLGQITQFLKGLKIVSVPDRPTTISAENDYNFSPIFDAIINPKLFFVPPKEKCETFNDQFTMLMQSDDLAICIEDGAPGTGKTTTATIAITNLILDAEKEHRKLPHILVTAPSNAATDVFYLKLRNRLPNFIICRLGEREKFREEVKSCSENDFAEFSMSYIEKHGDHSSKRKIKHEFILSATIIVATLGSSQARELIDMRNILDFDLLVVDECGQAKLDEFLFPLHFTSIRKVLLIGDPRQLGPILKSTVLMSLPNNKTSVFVKLCDFFEETAPQAIFRLREQYRMQPFVASMVSYISYQNTDQLITPENGNWVTTIGHPALIVFSGESWSQKRAEHSFSFINKNEAEFGMAFIRALLSFRRFNFETQQFPDGKSLTYAIISLYRAQVNLYNRLISEAKLDKIVKVYTVDQMQGSECDITIVSAVRASAEHITVGFASDLRRLNVALSRAACVYVLAKYDDFRPHQGWSKLFTEAIRKNCLYANADDLLESKSIISVLQKHSADDVKAQVKI